MRVLTVALITVISACSYGPESPRGFSLPKGDIELGKEAYVRFQCASCHQITGMPQPDVIEPEISPQIRLGGPTPTIKTYAELVTSIINPSHRLARYYPIDTIVENGKSKMRVYNDIMTVKELTDIVTYLETEYTLTPYRHTPYASYYPN